MTTLRERAARAAYEAYFAGLIGCCEDAWDELPPEHQERLMRAQDAAIAAIREHLSEPSEAVLQAALQAVNMIDGVCTRPIVVKVACRAAIAAALEEKP